MSLDRAHAFAAAAARRDFGAFLAYVGVDDRGCPFRAREFDRFVWTFAEECFADSAPCGLMLPMAFGKTSSACYRVAFEIGRDPNVLVSLVSYSSERATELVELVRGIIDLPTYQRVFPNVRVRAGKDSAGRFTVERDGVSNNPTCAGFGVLTGTGTRTNMLVLDDVVTVKNALLEPSSRGHVLEALRTTWMSRQHLRAGALRRTVWLQTAHHAADAAAVLREDPESGWRWLVVRAEEPYDVLHWERWERGARVASGVIPSPFPAEMLRERAAQMGPTAAARGLANRPVSGDICPFKEQHFQGPQPLAADRYLRRSFFADPAGDSTKARTSDTDYCSVVAIGLHPEDKCWEVYLAARIRGSPSRQAEFIARMALQAKAPVVYQEAIKDEALVGVTQEKLKDLGAYIPVRPEKPTTHKELRITQTLEPALAAGQLRICGRAFPELREEALCFPAAAHDDLVDALAGAFGKAQVLGISRHRSSVTPRAKDGEPAPDRERPRRRRTLRIWERRGRVWYD